MPRWEQRLLALGTEYGLEEDAVGRLRALLLLLAEDPHAPSAVREPREAVDVHVADSLTGLALDAVRTAGSLVDLGSGAGFPGLVLAGARPEAAVILVESAGRKAAWLERVVAELGLTNAEVVSARVEEWRPGGPVDVVTARALATLPVLIEYAAPLLALGGSLVAWKGSPDPDEEADGLAAAAALGLAAGDPVHVTPFPGVRDRRLYPYRKVRDTPAGYPRRPGMAVKRSLRASDRPRR